MIILGLGSNKGDRMANLRNAVLSLGRIMKNIKCSPIYESKALLPDLAPKEWDIDFLNMAICGDTVLAPNELLASTKTIERELGRIPTGHWGPREIDIDILAYDNITLDDEHLVIPHKYMLVRDFALFPASDIAPDWVYPVKGDFYGLTARQLAANLVSGLTKTSMVI